ncbi:MAG: deoxyribodipyrimidine photo-lyase [Candidatus Dependentiae bacterium]
MYQFKKSAFIFHRDLRLHDNTGLLAACNESKAVIPIFVFTPEQIGKNNKYRSDNAIQFMIESLQDLQQRVENRNGKLYLFHDELEHVVTKLIKKEKIDAVFTNKDYTPYAKKRDQNLEKLCKDHSVSFHAYDDALLNSPGKILTKSGEPYKVFTPFWKRSVQFPVTKDHAFRYDSFYNKKIDFAEDKTIYKKILKKEKIHPDPVERVAVHGGRTNGLKIMRTLNEFKNYDEIRNTPAIDTTLLSAHNKFGTVSIRELYWNMRNALGAAGPKGLIRQLYWRDFYYHIAYAWPKVFGHAFQDKYDKLTWSLSKKNFELWCEGKTGFPIVDAGMRQMNETGWMHNRARMIVASFLVKDLHINWLWGEKYFAQKLVDYDPCVNNGNWQWAASTGCDPQPYFRIFNPWLQQKKFDPECIYIKRWIPELENVDNKVIHNWASDKSPELNYPRPMVNHKKEKEIALKMFKQAG